ncbi:ABC transporter ATP-binding protein [Leifsonia sp. RAF41]|uniref:ABC transporter ATP-binding protein n=1 Tax=Leifsonia sp. RAF41 TaxID=3233056 RepID=UPI003F9687C6
MSALIEATGVSKSVRDADGGPRSILQDVSLTVAEGEMVSIVGPSGSGKSTLLYCLSGLEAPTAGSVKLQGTNLAALTARQMAVTRRDRIGFVFQAYNLIPSLSVYENVALPVRLARQRPDRVRILSALDRVGLSGFENRLPSTLSGGQQQRVAIARAVAGSPSVVFADEPTGALDSAAGAAVLDLLRELASDRAAVVMVTHDVDAAARADAAFVLRDGRIVERLRDPSPAAVFSALGPTPRTDVS